MNIDGVISFEPAENGIDDPDNYGMMPLPIPMLSHKEEPTITIKINRHRISQYIAAAAAIIIMFIFVTPLSEHTFKNDTKASLGNFASPEQISMMQQVSAPAPTAVVKSNCEICPIEESVKQENSTTPQDPGIHAIWHLHKSGMCHQYTQLTRKSRSQPRVPSDAKSAYRQFILTCTPARRRKTAAEFISCR